MKSFLSNSQGITNPFLDRIHLIHGDVVTQNVDAICTVIPSNLDFKGRLNNSINDASGGRFDEFILENIYKPKPGDVYALPAFDLPARHILLGVLPRYRSEFDRKDSDLVNMSRKIMELARCMLLTSIAIPAIGCGKKSFPKARGARLICQGVTERLQESFSDVRIVSDDSKAFEAFERKLKILGWKG